MLQYFIGVRIDNCRALVADDRLIEFDLPRIRKRRLEHAAGYDTAGYAVGSRRSHCLENTRTNLQIPPDQRSVKIDG